MVRILIKLLKLKRCYFCNKLGWYKLKMRIAESPKDYEAGGFLVPVCNNCYSEKEYR